MIQKLYYLGARAQEMHLYFHAAAFYRDICENFIRIMKIAHPFQILAY